MLRTLPYNNYSKYFDYYDVLLLKNHLSISCIIEIFLYLRSISNTCYLDVFYAKNKNIISSFIFSRVFHIITIYFYSILGLLY